MRNLCKAVALALALCSCPTRGAVKTQNRSRLAELSIDMNKAEFCAQWD